MENKAYKQKMYTQMQEPLQINSYRNSQVYQIKSSINFKHHKTRSKHQLFRPTKPQLTSQVQRYNPKIDTLSDHETVKDRSLSKKNNNQIDIQSRYQALQSFLKTQNGNLKEQNGMLLCEIKKILSRQKKYKDLYHKSQEQLDIMRQERDLYKDQLQQLKAISNNQLKQIQKKLNNQSLQVYNDSFDHLDIHLTTKKLSMNSNYPKTGRSIYQLYNE